MDARRARAAERRAEGAARFQRTSQLRFSQIPVLVRNDEVVAGRYFNDTTPATLHDVRSAGKSVTSLLVGAAVDRGRIHSLSDTVERYWPEARNSAIGDVPLRDILTMGSGLAAFIPSRNLVVAITSGAYGRGYGQRRSEAILKALLAKELQ